MSPATAIANSGLPWMVKDKNSGIEMVLILPGTFQQGATANDREKGKYETPQHRVTLTQSFYLGRKEVSNAEYGGFLKVADKHAFCHPDEPQGKDHKPRYWRRFNGEFFWKDVASKIARFKEKTFMKEAHPVVGVDWWDAYAYARWVGKRLPTQQEFEKAARGEQGNIWPWGNVWKYKNANTGGEKWKENDGFTYSAPADSFEQGKSVYGHLHLSGNVSEWTQEGMVAGGSSKSNPSQVRGAAFEVRPVYFKNFDIGFRCATDK